MKNNIGCDMNGIPFKYPSIELDSKEISKVMHEISNLYHVKYSNKTFIMHRTLDLHNYYCIYYVEIRGFGDYNIIAKIPD